MSARSFFEWLTVNRIRRLFGCVQSKTTVRWTGICAQEGEDDQAHTQGEGKRSQLSAHSRLDQVGNQRPLFQTITSFRHPNIVAYKEAFFEEDSQSLCIIMEYADGGDLYMKIVENTRRSQFFQ